MSPHDVILSEEEVSHRYKISQRTLQRWRVTGDGPRFVRVGLRRIGYQEADCEAWAEARTFASRAEELSQVA